MLCRSDPDPTPKGLRVLSQLGIPRKDLIIHTDQIQRNFGYWILKFWINPALTEHPGRQGRGGDGEIITQKRWNGIFVLRQQSRMFHRLKINGMEPCWQFANKGRESYANSLPLVVGSPRRPTRSASACAICQSALGK